MGYLEKSSRMLNEWLNYSQDQLYIPPERPDLMCYGSGYNGWGMQTHQKGFAAYAIAATSELKTDISKELLQEYSLKMLRYMLETHVEGGYHSVEGDKWGHTWISILGIERCMHAVAELIPYLNDEDKELLRKVLISEADWLLDSYPVEAGKDGSWSGEFAKSNLNRPESNMWNGAYLYRILSMYPDCPNAEGYRRKGKQFLVNAISVDVDAESEVVYDGDMVKDLYVGSNFFDSYALDHHSYLNVGYMVITLSNLAMYHFACKTNGFEVPMALYHRALELWKMVKTFMFEDGRLWRVGGDSRVRYCYCQDYVIPMLLFVLDYFGDIDAKNMLDGLVDIYEQEMEANGDGSFLSDRCAGFKKLSPIYYTRLESDRAAVLSMILCWDEYVDKTMKMQVDVYETWNEEFCGSYVVRGTNRMASWTLRGCTSPVVLCLPTKHSNLAEWEYNLFGEVKGASAFTKPQNLRKNMFGFDGGFAAIGTIALESDNFMAEQQKKEVTAVLTAVGVALPDDATMVVMQRAVSPERIYVFESKGLKLNVPNDVFNNKERRYYYDGVYHTMQAMPGSDTYREIRDGYINVDDVLGVYGGYGVDYTLYRPGRRNVGIKVHDFQDKLHEEYTYSFNCDEILRSVEKEPKWYSKGDTIFDVGAVVQIGINGQETEAAARQQAEVSEKITVTGSDMIRSIVTIGADGRTYVVVANFGKEESEIQINGGDFVDVTDKNSCPDVLGAEQVLVLTEVE